MERLSGPLPAASVVAPTSLLAGALGQVLSFGETGCPHSARRAASLLARLADHPQLDGEIRGLCERASQRLDQDETGGRHVPRA